MYNKNKIHNIRIKLRKKVSCLGVYRGDPTMLVPTTQIVLVRCLILGKCIVHSCEYKIGENKVSLVWEITLHATYILISQNKALVVMQFVNVTSIVSSYMVNMTSYTLKQSQYNISTHIISKNNCHIKLVLKCLIFYCPVLHIITAQP